MFRCLVHDVNVSPYGLQASAGKLLRVFTNWSVGRITYVTQLQLTMAVVMVFGCIVLALHGHIARAFPSNADEINPKVIAKAQRLAQRKERQHSGRSSSGGCARCRLPSSLPLSRTHEMCELPATVRICQQSRKSCCH